MKYKKLELESLTESEEVICSCKKKARVVWAKALGKYVSVDKSWKFKIPGGWYCGKKDHYQIGEIK